jgi:kumamolisin
VALLAVSSPAKAKVLEPEKIVGYPDLSKKGEVTLYLRSKTISAEQEQQVSALFTAPPRMRKYLSHEEVGAMTGAYEGDVAALTAHFKPLGLKVTSDDALTGKVTVKGDLGAIQEAFSTELAVQFKSGGRTALASKGEYQLPEDLARVVERIQPLTPPDRKESRLPIRVFDRGAQQRKTVLGAAAAPPPPTGYTTAALARACDFPPGATGKGQVIGLIELGGRMSPTDYAQFCQDQGLKPAKVIEVGVAPVISDPGVAFTDNMEVTLDLEILAAIAPQATLVIYYGNTIAEAMEAVVKDKVNKPTVVSISWAGSEYNYSPQEVQQMNVLFYQASLLGITVVAASADHGAYNLKTFPNVSLPSSHPLVLGCGGTIVTLTDDAISSEVVWNEQNGQIGSGGGYSALYPMPSYQQMAIAHYPYQKAGTRGVPDIAANSSMVNGYQMVFNGMTAPIGGTSASTPFVAGLIALLNEQLGYSLGFINAHLYALAGSPAFRQVTQGNNQLYAAAPYWNPCTGLGSPIGTRLLELLRQL